MCFIVTMVAGFKFAKNYVVIELLDNDTKDIHLGCTTEDAINRVSTWLLNLGVSHFF